MIFVTVGSQKMQFNRLIKAIDEQVANGLIKEEVFAQTGACDYKPMHYRYADYLNRDDYVYETDRSDIVITHGGTGAIVGSIKKGKKVIAVPRLKRFGEHVDDHQMQIVEEFENAKLISACFECDEIWKHVELVRTMQFNAYESNTQTIINSIEDYISECFNL